MLQPRREPAIGPPTGPIPHGSPTPPETPSPVRWPGEQNQAGQPRTHRDRLRKGLSLSSYVIDNNQQLAKLHRLVMRLRRQFQRHTKSSPTGAESDRQEPLRPGIFCPNPEPAAPAAIPPTGKGRQI